MDPRQITRLAKLLRDNGDKVLNSEFKITLTGSLLRALNDSFTLITDPNETCTPQTFQVLKPNNAKSDVFRELQIIYDFVQKTQILCLTTIPTEDPFDGAIDIVKFRALKRLEIQRIPIEQIVGIQRLRAHLQELICCKSIKSIQSIIAHCGGDNANGFLWNELKIVDFSYNCLKTIDCSLEFVSNLQQLNLSHNQIVSVDAIKWLPNLKKLNLSYNNLTQIPQNIASRRLQSLILNNNFIEDMSGLPKLDALNELNLAENCILDHAVLAPLGSLIALQQLQLHGNPISCHPNHREETSKYLHKNVASVKFVLDLQPLNKYEKNLVGHYQSFNNWYASRKASMLKRSTGQLTPSIQAKDLTPASSIGSFRSFRMESNASSSGDLTNGTDLMNTSQISCNQKRIKVRPALIADSDNNDDNAEVVVENAHKKENTGPKIVEIDEIGKREHLETKKQIEELRKEFGDSWLHSKGASKVQNVIGMQPSPAKQTGKSPQTTEQMLEKLFGMENASNSNQQRSSTPIQSADYFSDFVQSSSEQFQSPVSSKTEFQSIADSDLSSQTLKSVQNSTINDTTFESTTSAGDHLENIYPYFNDEPEIASDNEDNEVIYLVTNEPNQMELLLVVSDQSIREKNSLTARTINKWNMTMLESCERIKSDVLRIRFDTVKRDKKERTYNLEKGQAQRLDDFLRNILSKRPLSEMNQVIFRCANCALEFSSERLFRKKGNTKCPKCNSTYVIEMKETDASQLKPEKESALLEKSNSQSSIDSASSFNESLSQSKLSSYSQSSFDSNQSLIGSTTNCDPTNDLDNYFASRFGAPLDSDVEILSNPSISSIEVLDRFSRQSSRKQSDDLRNLLQTQLYVQQHQRQFNKSSDGSSQSPSLDIIEKSTSNSDIEEILDEPPSNASPVDEATETRFSITAADTMVDGISENIVTNDSLLKPNKRPILTGMNLTESSSSGSVTDSVCTAYEHQAIETKNFEQTNTTMVTTTAVSSVEQDSVRSIDDDKDLDETIKTEEVSTISTMLGGLFNSTNLLMSRTKSTPSKSEQPPCEKFKFSYIEFDSVDHRLKLFLYQNIFEDDNEHLKWLVKGRIFNDCSTSDPDTTLQSAIFVMSTTKWYVLNIIGPECDDVTKWLKREVFGTIDRVEMVRVFPWKVGITFSIKFFGHIHFFLQDIMRTDSLLLFFADNPLPGSCDLEYQISERISQKLLQITNNVQLKMFAILNCCIIRDNDESKTVHDFAALIVTDEHLYITTTKYGWLIDKLDQNIVVAKTQLMTDLVDVENINVTTFAISFLDEIQDRKEKWTCHFETESCLNDTFAPIAQSWEKLFKVPLAN